MQRTLKSNAFNRRQLLSLLGAGVVVAVPTMTHASKMFDVQRASQSQSLPPTKTLVISF